eukprot:NODE_5376_length_412_cov_5.650138_g4695_i0.p3 GENE.NODE_5376_length_412_cov_5.650138_g4695_i0~~NODE_5376_length_412_cov_5.650138_g4695_i0.p3  ORF type:complete len:54 (-),score=9.95 NODE_5376_length_412_cov_5.650138_g4695_i0:73-234(-)
MDGNKLVAVFVKHRSPNDAATMEVSWVGVCGYGYSRMQGNGWQQIGESFCQAL